MEDRKALITMTEEFDKQYKIMVMNLYQDLRSRSNNYRTLQMRIDAVAENIEMIHNEALAVIVASDLRQIMKAEINLLEIKH